MASIAASQITSKLHRLTKPFTTFWKRLGEPPQRSWAHQLVERAAREQIRISPGHCLLFCRNAPREVAVLVSQSGYAHLSVVDVSVMGDYGTDQEHHPVIYQYESSLHLSPTSVSWEYPCLKLEFGEVVINHYLCEPSELVLSEAPSLVLIWDIDPTKVNHSQGWVAALDTGTTILCSDLYPLLHPDEPHKLGQNMHGGSASRYRAQELFYGPSGLTIHETHSLLGYLTRN